MKAFTIKELLNIIKEIKEDLKSIEQKETFKYERDINLSSVPFHLMNERLSKAFPEYKVNCDFTNNKIRIFKSKSE